MQLTIFTIIVICIFGIAGLRYKAADSLPLYVLWAQAYFSVTLVFLLDINEVSEAFYLNLILLSILSYTLSIICFSRLIKMKKPHNFEFLQLRSGEMFKIFCLFVLSFTVLWVYYYAGGYNLFLSLILGNVIEDFTSMRLALYSSGKFSGAGIANQFKNVIFPFCIFVYVIWIGQRNKLPLFFKYIFISILMFSLLWAVLGTGQRAPLVYVFLGFLFSAALLGKFKIRFFVLPVILIIILFGIFTILNGRSEDSSITSILAALIERAVFNDQHEGIVSFKYIYDRPISAFEDWALDFRGLLPSYKGSPLAHDIFATIHGTNRGMAGIPTLVSVYHNGGILFVPIFYVLLGLIVVVIQYRLRSGKKSVSRSVIYGSVYMIFVLFFTGAPVSLLNKGLLGVLLVTLVMRLNLKKKRYITSMV